MYVPERPAARGVKVGPVLLPGPGAHPRLGVHPEPAAPHVVLLAALGLPSAALLRQLLGDGADVVGLKSAATTDVPANIQEDKCNLIYSDTNPRTPRRA